MQDQVDVHIIPDRLHLDFLARRALLVGHIREESAVGHDRVHDHARDADVVGHGRLGHTGRSHAHRQRAENVLVGVLIEREPVAHGIPGLIRVDDLEGAMLAFAFAGHRPALTALVAQCEIRIARALGKFERGVDPWIELGHDRLGASRPRGILTVGEHVFGRHDRHLDRTLERNPIAPGIAFDRGRADRHRDRAVERVERVLRQPHAVANGIGVGIEGVRLRLISCWFCRAGHRALRGQLDAGAHIEIGRGHLETHWRVADATKLDHHILVARCGLFKDLRAGKESGSRELYRALRPGHDRIEVLAGAGRIARLQTQTYGALERDELLVRHIHRVANGMQRAVDGFHAACGHGRARDLSTFRRLSAKLEVLVCILRHEFDLGGELSLQWLHEGEPAELPDFECLISKGHGRLERNAEFLEALAVRRDIVLLALARELNHAQLKAQVLTILGGGVVRQAHGIADRMRGRRNREDLVATLALRGAGRLLAGLLLNAKLDLNTGLCKELEVRRHLAAEALHIALPAGFRPLEDPVREGNRRREDHRRRLTINAESLRAGKVRVIGRAKIYLDRLVDLLCEVGGQVHPVADAGESRAECHRRDAACSVIPALHLAALILHKAGRDRTLGLPHRVVSVGGKSPGEGDHDIARTCAANRELGIRQLQGRIRTPENFDSWACDTDAIIARLARIVLRDETQSEALVESLVNIVGKRDTVAGAIDEPRPVFLFFLAPLRDQGLIGVSGVDPAGGACARCLLNAGLNGKAGSRDLDPRLGRDIAHHRFQNVLGARRAGRELDIVKCRGRGKEDWRGLAAYRNSDLVIERLVVIRDDPEGDVLGPIHMHIIRQHHAVANGRGFPRHIEHHLAIGCRAKAGRLVACIRHVASAQIEIGLRNDHLETGGDFPLDRHEDVLLLGQALLENFVAESEIGVELDRNRRARGAQREAHDALSTFCGGKIEGDGQVLLDMNVRRHARTQTDGIGAIGHEPFLSAVKRALSAFGIGLWGCLVAKARIGDAARHLEQKIGVERALKRHELRLLPALGCLRIGHVDKGHRSRVRFEDDGRRRARNTDRVGLHEGRVLGIAHLEGDDFVNRLELALAEVHCKADLFGAIGNADLDFRPIFVRLPTGDSRFGFFLGALRADAAIGLSFRKDKHLCTVEVASHLHEFGLPVSCPHREFNILEDDRRLEDHDELGARDREIECLEMVRIVDGMHFESGAALEGDQNVIGKLHTEAHGIGTCRNGELDLAVACIGRAGVAAPGAALEACFQTWIGLRDLDQQVRSIGLVEFDHRMGPARCIGFELDVGEREFMEGRRLTRNARHNDLPDLLCLGLERRGEGDRHRPGHRFAHVARQEELVAQGHPIRANGGRAGRSLDQATAHFRTRVSTRADAESTLVTRGFGIGIGALFTLDGSRSVRLTGLIERRLSTRINDEDQLFFAELAPQSFDDALLANSAGREFDVIEDHLWIKKVSLGLAEYRDVPSLV